MRVLSKLWAMDGVVKRIVKGGFVKEDALANKGIRYGDHPKGLDGNSEDQQDPCASMTNTSRKVQWRIPLTPAQA